MSNLVGNVFDSSVHADADGNVEIDGSLTVNGATTTVSTTNTVVKDKLIELGNGTSGAPSGDAGIIIERGSSNNAAIIWDESADTFVVGTTTATGASTGDLSVTDAALKTAAITSSGVVTATGFTIGNAVIAESELEQIDGITAGTVVASKAVVVDSNKDVGTIRNLTIDGTFSDGNYTFDTSGNVSGLGTVGCGAITTSGVLDITDTTDASDASGDTGALRTEGGASIAKKAFVGTDLSVGGDIILDDGGSLKEAGGTAAFTFDGSGNVTQIGVDTQTSGHFLKWNGTKWLAAEVTGTVAGSVAADDISVGDAAINLTTTTGSITIDAQAGDADIIFKGTDGSSDITALTLDMSEAGAATFNDKVIATELDISGNCDIDGTTNLDNTDIDGTLVVDGSNISLDSTSTLNIDNSNTSNGITIGTATSGVPISIGHGTSETTVNDNLTVSGGLTVTGDTTSSNGFIGFANGQNATLKVAVTGSGTDGRDLTVEAGSAPAGATNQNGGDLLLKSGDGDGNGTSIMTFSTKTAAADTAAERMRIGTNGNVVINGSTAHAASLAIDGASASIALKEMANAPADVSSFGQLWVKTGSPNELYFTNEDGDDIQLTSGTSTAGGGGTAADDVNLLLHQQVFGR